MKALLNLLLFCFLLAAAPALGQQLLKGKILDENSGVPVQGAHILNKASNTVAISSKDGAFSIMVSKFPVIIEVTHVSYKTLSHQIDNEEEVHLLLQPKVLHLPGITIKSGEIENLMPEKKLLAMDYQLHGDKLLILSRNLSDGKYMLSLTGLSGNIIYSRALNEKPEKLLKDCEGYLYLLFQDINYSLSIKDSMVSFTQVISMEEIQSISRCEMELNGRYYYAEFADNKQSLFYYYVLPEFPVPVKVAEVVDEKKLKMLADEFRFATTEGFRYTEYDAAFASLIVYAPVYAPVFKTSAGFCVFNFVNNKIEHFDSENFLQKEVPVNYHRLKGWKKQMYLDEKTGRVFQLFELNSTAVIREVDIHTGALSGKVELKGFSFPENIKAYDGFIYFIARNPDKQNIRQVYRIRA
jgi:hypothetical protein